MTNVKMLVAKVAISLVAVGSLTTVGVGVSGAATSGAATTHTHHTTGGERRLACTRDAKHLALSTRRQAQFATHTAVFVGLEANAKKAGHTSLAAYWAKVVQRRQSHSARQHDHFVARSLSAAENHGLVNGKCA